MTLTVPVVATPVSLVTAAGHPVEYEPHLPPDVVWRIDGQYYAGSKAYRQLTGSDPAAVEASTPAYLPWYAPGYVFPDPPMGPPALPGTPDERFPEPKSEWCCGGTCLRVNCEYHRDQ